MIIKPRHYIKIILNYTLKINKIKNINKKIPNNANRNSNFPLISQKLRGPNRLERDQNAQAAQNPVTFETEEILLAEIKQEAIEIIPNNKRSATDSPSELNRVNKSQKNNTGQPIPNPISGRTVHNGQPHNLPIQNPQFPNPYFSNNPLFPFVQNLQNNYHFNPYNRQFPQFHGNGINNYQQPIQVSNRPHLPINKSINIDLTNSQAIEDCKALIIKYLEEKNYKAAQQEAQKGLTLHNCTNAQKFGFFFALLNAYFNLKEWENLKQTALDALKFPDSTNAQKFGFFFALRNAYFNLKEWENLKQTALDALKLPDSTNAQKFGFFFALYNAYDNLKEWGNLKQTALDALKLPDSTNAQKFGFFFALLNAYFNLKDWENLKQTALDALKLPDSTNAQKFGFFFALLNAYFNLKDWENLKQTALDALKLPDSTNAQKFGFFFALYNAYLNLKEWENLKQTALDALDPLQLLDSTQKILFFLNLSAAYYHLKEYANSQQIAQDTLKLTECNNDHKSKLYRRLSLAHYQLQNYASSQEAANRGLAFSEITSFNKSILLGVLLKLTNNNNQDEEFQTIVNLIHTLTTIQDASNLKEAIDLLSDVITPTEILTKLSVILNSSSNPEFKKSIWKKIEELSQLAQL